jgi:hypothetical protein
MAGFLSFCSYTDCVIIWGLYPAYYTEETSLLILTLEREPDGQVA